jgi:hypothetical protein
VAAWIAAPAAAVTARPPLAVWFGSQTCPALDGLYSKKTPPPVKTGSESLVVDVPPEATGNQPMSLTVPWYLYDPSAQVAISHIGGDSGVVWTLRVVNGPPPSHIPTFELGNVRTTSGLKIGSSAASVIKVLGKPLIIRACGLERFEYSDSNQPDGEQNDLDFTIKNDRVIEIMHTSWG